MDRRDFLLATAATALGLPAISVPRISVAPADPFDMNVLHDLLSKLPQPPVSELMDSLDKIGRLLFMVYWHEEAMKEKVGAEDYREMTGVLKQLMVDLGTHIEERKRAAA